MNNWFQLISIYFDLIIIYFQLIAMILDFFGFWKKIYNWDPPQQIILFRISINFSVEGKGNFRLLFKKKQYFFY